MAALFAGIQVTVHGEQFLIFQDMRIQKPLQASGSIPRPWGNACTLTLALELTLDFMNFQAKGSTEFGTSINQSLR